MAISKWLFLMIASSILVLSTPAQDSPKDIAAIFAEGRIRGHEYRSDYFGLTLTVQEAQFTHGAFLSNEGKRARLVDAQTDLQKPEENYGIAVLADQLAVNPAVHSPEQYVRAVRHAFEREGEQTIDEQFSMDISGVRFAGASTKVNQNSLVYYHGVFTTFLKGYILSLEVKAATPELLKQVARGKVKFDVSVGK